MTPTPEEIKTVLTDRSEIPEGKGRIMIPGKEAPVVKDVERLGKVLQAWFYTDYKARVDSGFYALRDYAEDAYFQRKDPLMMDWPWPNASAYRAALTPVLLDTLTANLEQSMHAGSDRMSVVTGVGPEDRRTAARASLMLASGSPPETIQVAPAPRVAVLAAA